MQCGSLYTKNLIIPSSDTAAIVDEICKGYTGSCFTKGFMYIYKYPPPITLTTCIELFGKHYHGILESGKALIASDSPGFYFYASEEGSTKIPYNISNKLKIKEGDNVVLRQIIPEKATSIALQPL